MQDDKLLCQGNRHEEDPSCMLKRRLKVITMLLTHLRRSKINCKSALVLRACLQWSGGPQVGEIILSYMAKLDPGWGLPILADGAPPPPHPPTTFGGSLPLLCKRYEIIHSRLGAMNLTFHFSSRLCKNTVIICATRDALNLGVI